MANNQKSQTALVTETTVKARTLTRKSQPKPSVAFDTYWKFAALRQEIYFSKLRNDPRPWTSDATLEKYRFTNTYRAADRVSQFLIKNVQYSQEWSWEDNIFRTLLFKLFNKIETWQFLEEAQGQITANEFDFNFADKSLNNALNSQAKIYSAAYIIPTGSKNKYGEIRKHSFHLLLLKHLLATVTIKQIRDSNSLESLYKNLLHIDSFGPFLAFQFAIDLNYSPHFSFSENDFVVAGPGAKAGIRKCFTDLGEYSEEDVIKFMVDEQEKQFEKLNLNFQTLWGRRLHLIDCQNIFCEVDKYCRVELPQLSGENGRQKIKQTYKPNISPIEPWFPPKWGINSLLEQR